MTRAFAIAPRRTRLRAILGLTFAAAGALALCALAPAGAQANPTPGFIEHWPGFAGTAGWGGGASTSNPGSGGVLGANDGYLLIQTPGPDPFFSTHLGSTSVDPPYSGNWITGGVATVKFWLNDVGAPDALEMHFVVGSNSNLWQYNAGFIPPAGSWAQFSVDLTQPSGWTHIIDSPPGGTFTGALSAGTRVLIRHDLAPYSQTPNDISGDVGVDEFSMEAGSSTGVPLGSAPSPRAVSLAAPYPNPSQGTVTLAMQSFDGSPITIEVLDALGRRIRRASLDAAGPGNRQWTWDGLDESGQRTAPGVYRVRAWSASGGMSRPLVRIAGTR